MKKAEINMVAINSKKALELYKQIFELENITETNMELGQNEVTFSLYDMNFHMLDENKDFALFAPNQEQQPSSWFDITVENINETFEKAIRLGCEVIMPVAFLDTHNLYHGMFKDTFGYVWLLHQAG